MDDESGFLNAKVDELQRAPDVTSEHAAGVMDIVGDRHKQAQRLRPWFLLAAFVLAAASVATSCGVVIWYIVHAGQQADSAVLVGFFTSTVLETLGILYIIARYLFPSTSAAHADPPQGSG